MLGGMYWSAGRRQRPQVRVTRALLFRILGYFRPYLGEVSAALFTVAVIAAIGLVPPLLVRAVVDLALPEKDLGLLAVLAVGMVGAPILSGLLGVGQNYLNTRISQRVMFDLRTHLYRHVQSLSLRFFTSVKTGEIMSRLNNDVSGISRVLGETLTQTVAQAFMLLTTLILVFSLDWRLATLSVAMAPIFLAPTRRVGNIRYDLQKETQEKHADLTAIMQETLNISGYILMKSFGRERYEAGRFTEKNRELMAVQVRSSLLGRWFRMLLQVFEALGPALIYLYGGYLVITGGMTLGSVIAFVTLLGRLYGPIGQLANVQIEVMGSLALFHRIFEYLDTEPEIKDLPTAVNLGSTTGRIVFSDVSFEYVPGIRVLDHVSFAAQPGELVALVGPSGAGKTTVTYLIPRFYDVTEGSIEIDGHDLRTVTVSSLHEQIGIVTQETYLFNATVRENLRYANLDATDSAIEEACRLARLEEVVSRMPDGYDTLVGERGYRLSGGEKQRVAIARVLLKDPRVLILDEATSSLDSQTEAQIQEALRPLLTGRTTFAIAHRLSTVLAADKILVLDRGHIVEAGTHAELIANGGLYAELYEIQFKPQSVGDRPLSALEAVAQ
ncbi:MAG: ABC transporter ATP-binding protein [Chloroflexi bacterium]|nr:ABC transporter ATP-binding protein [Chloroflexota bacterium]